MGFLSGDRERKLREEVHLLQQEVHEIHHIAQLLYNALTIDSGSSEYPDILYQALNAYAKHNAIKITGI